jgi:hypothetical protein
MNAKATAFLNRMGAGDITGNSTINELISKIHRGGTRKRRHRRNNRKSKINKKYTWPFW